MSDLTPRPAAWTDEAPRGTPYWWADAPLSQIDTAAPPKHADIVVIGAGYTGLSAALTAADGGATVVVLEAGQPGAGASARNGGMFGAHPRLGWDALAKSFGPQTANDLFAEATTALVWAQDLIARESIDCDLQTYGRIQLAWTEAQFARQKVLAASVTEKSDVRVQVVDRSDLAQEIATEQYFGGVLFPEHGGLHPAKYHAGLLAAVRRRGVPVLGQCPATGLQRTGNAHVITTPRGTITSDKVILATNGYTSDLFRWHQARVFPLPSYLIATEELPSNLLGHLAPGRRMMVETRARHSYFRLSPDGKRILFGGRAAMVDIDLNRAANRLRTTLLEIWPELSDAKLSHVWSGNTGYSFNHMPHVGTEQGLHYALGFSGSGTVMAPYLGAKAAYQALGDPRGATGYAKTALKRSWLHPFRRPHFLHAADGWYHHWVDRRETRQGRRAV